MGFPRDHCLQALRHNGNDLDRATDWLLANPLPDAGSTVSSSGCSADAKLRLLQDMGFPPRHCADALVQNNDDIEAAVQWLIAPPCKAPPAAPAPSPAPAFPPQAEQHSDWRFDPELQNMCKPTAMPTEGGGNCLFHALVHALRDLSVRRRPGHVFPLGRRLPSNHEHMRDVVVNFASQNRHVFGLFFENNMPLTIGEAIDTESRSFGDNKVIQGGGRFGDVDHYFQVRSFCHVFHPDPHSSIPHFRS